MDCIEIDWNFVMKLKKNWLGCFLLACSAIGWIAFGNSVMAQTVPSAGMMRYPDVSAEKIVFVYADDLWVVDRNGGQASPLASPAGAERNPRFSPDGKTIAFMGNYDGGSDLYTIPTNGGVPERMTFHPATETLCDWMPDGQALLYSTNGFSGLSRQPQLFTISRSEPLPKKMPVPYGTNGAVSADGRTLAYTPHSRDTRTWKRYRGGMASDVWLFDLKSHTARQITDFEGTDSLPMWHGDNVYYLSDNGPEHRLNIWVYSVKSGARHQVTKFQDYDCKWPSLGPGPKGQGEIILQNGAGLYLVDLKTGKAKTVSVTIPGARPSIRPQSVDASKLINGGDISPKGKRIVLEARGDIWTVPVKNGPPRNLTHDESSAERSPSWSPDGRWIAYFSDRTGEYELYVTQSDGRGETRQLTRDGKLFRYAPNWSPDSRWITFTDNSGGLYLHDMDKGTTRQIDTDPQARRLNPSWSADSTWMVYARNGKGRGAGASLWVFNVQDQTHRKITSGFFNDSNPVFDRKGDYVYFSSNRAFNSPRYEDLGTTFIYSGTEILMAMPLRNDVRNPFLPKVDEEEWEKSQDAGSAQAKKSDDSQDAKKTGEKKPADQDGGKPDSTKKETSEKPAPKNTTRIDLDGIEARSFQLPVGQGSFGSLVVNNKNQLIYSERPPRGESGTPSIKLIDLAADSPKPVTVVEGASSFTATADGSRLLVFRGSGFYVIAAAAGQKLSSAVSTDGMMTTIEPRKEWKQIFVDAWRLEREFFYDPTMHGVDWQAVRKQYEPLIDECASRRDLSFVIREMIAELNVGHAYYRETSVDQGPRTSVGLLGCQFEAAEGRYRIGTIYRGAPWDADARNPLDVAGINPGEFVLAVNDLPLTSDRNPYELFQGLGGKTVVLTVSKDSKPGDDRRVALKALSSDSNLRFRHWIENNRKIVDEKSKGRVGYIYVVNTGIPGQNDLVRQFYGQLGKEALIIDDRWNGGGQIPTRFIELLNRPVTNYWALRHGADWTWPPDSHQGPKCMLINGLAGSGGDMFPALFRQAGLGKLIGMRTWGGLVGISGGPRLVDGASVTAPNFAYYEKDGTWGIEGHGVDPDIEVVDNPAQMTDGGDPQLDAAIKQMLGELKSNPYKAPRRPPYPDRSKFGIKPEDK